MMFFKRHLCFYMYENCSVFSSGHLKMLKYFCGLVIIIAKVKLRSCELFCADCKKIPLLVLVVLQQKIISCCGMQLSLGKT